MTSRKFLLGYLMAISIGLILLSGQSEAGGPMLIFKMGKRHGGGGGHGGLLTLLAAGAVAKLLQGGSGGARSYHQPEPLLIGYPVQGQHMGMGGGGGMDWW